MCDLNATFVGFCLERGKREGGLLPFSNLITLCGRPVNMLRFGVGLPRLRLPPPPPRPPPPEPFACHV
jgi:hypothetical protein